MTEFSTEAELSFSDRSLSRASRQLERELSGITISHETDTTAGRIGTQQGGGGVSSTIASTAVGTKLSGVSGSLEETLELDQERNTILAEILEGVERGAAGGGGGSVSGLIGLGGIAGLLSSGMSLSSVITPVSLSALVSSVSLSTLITGGLAASTLITTGLMAKNLIQGDVSPSDVIKPLNSLGDFITGPLPLTEAFETGVGLTAFIAGGVSIASFISKAGLGSLVSKVGLSSLVTKVSAGSLISQAVSASRLIALGSGSLVSASSLVSLATGALIPAGAFVTGTIAISELVDRHPGQPGGGSYGPDEMRTSASTPAAQQGGIDYDALEGIDAPTDQEVANFDPNSFSLEDVGGEPIGEESQMPNWARERSSGGDTINFNPTINADFRDLRREMDRMVKDFERELDDIRRAMDKSRRLG